MSAPLTTAMDCDEDPWMFHMRRGNFAAAWNISDSILRSRAGRPCWHLPRHEQYVWDGRSLANQRVLIRCYHGLGDTVQFIRFAPLVKAIAREVVVWAQPVLLRLLRTARGIDRLIPLHDGTPEVDYDVDVESMELAHVFRVSPETLPSSVPYIDGESAGADCPGIASPTSAQAVRGNTTAPGREGTQKEVGIVWSSGMHDESRSVPLQYLEPLLKLRHVRWHILQRGPAYSTWPAGIGVHDGSDNIEETARLMRSLDLVISVDSFPAHLAGALGVPVWTLLQHQADWRWMTDRADTPWYPTMRLFRQPRPGDWRSVIEQVRGALGS